MKAELIVFNLGEQVKVIPIEEKGAVTVGRSPGNTIILDDSYTSRHHCTIQEKDGEFIITDHNSLNGSWVNGHKITEHTLVDGDKIKIGRTQINFITPEEELQLIPEPPEESAEGEDVPKVTCYSCGAEAKATTTASDDDTGLTTDTTYICQECKAADPLLGAQLNGYRLLKKINEGGMASLYEGVQLSLGRKVAVKVLKAETTEKARNVKRFFREALIGASLQHPNLVQIYDSGTVDSRHFIVMEFVKGQSALQLTLERGAVAQQKVIEIALGALAALDYAHKNNIIHRDVKLSNILVSDAGVVKLTDLGLSKLRTDDADLNITHTGDTFGTSQYMSPEQITDAKTVDERTDIYSLGVGMYIMLVGKRPYNGEGIVEVHKNIMNGVFEPLDEVAPSLDADLVAVVHKMMATNRDDRYQNAQEVIEALTKITL